MDCTEVCQLLESLTDKPNDVTHLDLSYGKMGIKEAKLLSKFLVSSNCHVTHLELKNNRIAENNEFICIAKAMADNKTVIHLDLSDYLYFGDTVSLDEFVKELAISIQYHPSIRYLYLDENNIWTSLLDLAKHMPKSLKHLSLSNNDYFDAAHFRFLLENTKLESVDITCMHRIQDGILPSIEANRSIVRFDHISHLTYNVRPEVMEAISAMLKRNRDARDSAKMIALMLIAIRKFRRSNCGLLGWVPKELVIIIAKHIFESYVDDEWRYETHNKRLCA
jgi:hypothetical protein